MGMTQSLSGYTSTGPANASYGDLSAANPMNPSGEFLPQYGGYAAGYSDTLAREQQLAQQAQGAKAAHANFGQANAYLGQQNAWGKLQGALGAQEGQTAGQLSALAAGHGLSAADYGIPTEQSAAIAGAQNAGAAGGALAQRNALAGLGTNMSSIASGYGSGMAGTMQGAQGQLTGQYGAMGSLYGQQGSQDVGAAQMAGQQAAFNPGLQAQQNRVNDATALSYYNALLGVQQQQGAAMNNATAADTAYQLAEQQHNAQVMGQALGTGLQVAGTVAAVAA
jgi:hypothetical protein